MASTKPIVRQIAWLSLLPTILLTGGVYFLYSLFVTSWETVFMLSILTLLVLLLALRYGISPHHRKGISWFKKGDYVSAIKEFEKSYHFFTKKPWVDKYRCIFLLSASRTSYTEMALLNIAFCYTQSGKGASARQYYEKTLELFPDSGMAAAALQMIRSMENQTQ